jgi:hypothetical protein
MEGKNDGNASVTKNLSHLSDDSCKQLPLDLKLSLTSLTSFLNLHASFVYWYLVYG